MVYQYTEILPTNSIAKPNPGRRGRGGGRGGRRRGIIIVVVFVVIFFTSQCSLFCSAGNGSLQTGLLLTTWSSKDRGSPRGRRPGVMWKIPLQSGFSPPPDKMKHKNFRQFKKKVFIQRKWSLSIRCWDQGWSTYRMVVSEIKKPSNKSLWFANKALFCYMGETVSWYPLGVLYSCSFPPSFASLWTLCSFDQDFGSFGWSKG